MRVKFGPNFYDLVPGGYSDTTGKLNIMIIDNGYLVDDVVEVVSDKNNVETVTVLDGTTTVINYRGYTHLETVSKLFNYTYDSHVDEETGEMVEESIDVFKIVLTKDNLEDTVSKNTSDIEYIAIMSDIELE